jgi:hypothetical protein
MMGRLALSIIRFGRVCQEPSDSGLDVPRFHAAVRPMKRDPTAEVDN